MNKENMKFQFTLVVGDWSDDGHGKTANIAIKSNLSPAEVLCAYETGSKKLGFDLINTVAEVYEDRAISREKWNAFVKLGFDCDLAKFDVPYDNGDDDDLSLCYEAYTSLYLFVIKLGEPDFQCEPMNNKSIQIGGYGLF